MSFKHGPEVPLFWHEESSPSELERLYLMQGLAVGTDRIAQELGASQNTQGPILRIMLGKLIEGGPNLCPNHVSHLRRMIALGLRGLPDIVTQAEADQELVRLAEHTVSGEIKELNSIPKADEFPYPWDIAVEDLCRLEMRQTIDSTRLLQF